MSNGHPFFLLYSLIKNNNNNRTKYIKTAKYFIISLIEIKNISYYMTYFNIK